MFYHLLTCGAKRRSISTTDLSNRSGQKFRYKVVVGKVDLRGRYPQNVLQHLQPVNMDHLEPIIWSHLAKNPNSFRKVAILTSWISVTIISGVNLLTRCRSRMNFLSCFYLGNAIQSNVSQLIINYFNQCSSSCSTMT